MLAIRLPKDIETRLATLASKTGRSKTYYAKEAILAYLEGLEDFYLAEDRLLASGGAKGIPLEELVRRYGMED